MQSSLKSEFLLPELDSDPEEPFIPCCLFCCGNLRLKNYGIRSQDSKLGLFCQAFNLTEEPFERGLRMSPLCPNCVALIERIGGMLERIQELELKLKLEKETVLELLRQDFPDQPSSSSSSPLQFRGEIQKKLNISPNIGTCPPKNEGKITESGLDKSDETDNSFDLEDEPLNSAEDQVDEVDIDCKSTSSLRNKTYVGESSRIFEEHPLLMAGGPDVKLERSEETGVKYTLPAGIVLKDCTVQLERGRKAEVGAEKILREQSLKKDSGKAGVVPKHPAKRRIRKKKIIPEPRDPKKPIPCKYIGSTEYKCSQFFPDEESMIAHVRKIHVPGLDCTICGATFGSRKSFLRHKVVDHGEPYPFNCKECGKGFMESEFLKYHSVSHTGGPSLRKKKNRHSQYREPQDRKDPKKTVPCKYFRSEEENCRLYFVDEQSMLTHVQLVHIWKGSDCEICGDSLESKPKLLRHKIHVHGEPPPYVCTVEGCGKRFITSGSLKVHAYSHTGDYPYRCEKCGLGFGNLSKLREHSNVHLDKEAKNFVCDVCGKTFKSLKLVTLHQWYHFEEKKHKCTLCTWAFKTIGSLNKHLKTVHTSDRPHCCQQCGVYFKDKAKLTQHLKRDRERKLKFSYRKRTPKPPPSDPL